MNQFRKCYIPRSGRKNGCLVSILGDLVSTPSNELFSPEKLGRTLRQGIAGKVG